ncbi:MAG: ATP synthase subunit I [Betaproteobacteria bacterium]|nr:ATP synthase subunit I [Betaproteobacteria bacterium]
MRTVLRWQAYATVVLALAGGLLWGKHTGVSALLGGMISIAAGWVFAVAGGWGATRSAGPALLSMLRAEAAKIGLMVLLLWLVLTMYEDVVAAGLIGSFLVTVVIFAMAIFVREN